MDDLFKIVVFGIAIVICIGIWAAMVIPLLRRGDSWRNEFVKKHPGSTVGMPVAGASAFLIVTFYGVVAGPLKINLWGLQIEGAGGPVLLWIACFLAIALAIRMSWNLKP